MKWFKKNPKESALLIVCIALFIILSVAAPDKFLTSDNITSMMIQIPEFGIMTLGMMVIILTNGINLSLTYVASVSGISMAMVMRDMGAAGYDVAACIICGIIVGFIVATALGLLNGILVAKLHVSPILATLGTMMLYEGIGLNITQGSAISIAQFYENFGTIGNGTVGIIPIPMIIFIIVAIFAYFLFERTPWGVRLHMLGSNPIAVNYSGINVGKILMQAYLVSAFFCFISAIIMAARYNSMKVDTGNSYLMQSILATVMGGTNISGGYGKVGGTVLAIVTLQFVSSGLKILDVNSFFIDAIMGAILIGVLAINFVYDKAQKRNLMKNIRTA